MPGASTDIAGSGKNYRWGTALITGGGGGLGRVMAESFIRQGKKVIIAGRTEKTLRETCEANPGMQYLVVDTGHLASLPAFVASLLKTHPTVDCLVNNAGILKPTAYITESQNSNEVDIATRINDANAEISINITGVVHLVTLLLPHLQRKTTGACIINVSSSLGFVPLARAPVYSATKAFLHSYTISLRTQMEQSAPHIRIIEVAPPLVESNIGRYDHDTKKNGLALTQQEFLEQFEQGMVQGDNEIAPGTSDKLAKSWWTIYNDTYLLINGLAAK